MSVIKENSSIYANMGPTCIIVMHAMTETELYASNKRS